jgi:serine/threonine protein kinase
MLRSKPPGRERLPLQNRLYARVLYRNAVGLSPGDRVDRYEVLELLGAGGMGEVYRARDSKLARLVALKVLLVDSGPGTEGAARLLREARAAAALSHANVLAIYDVGEVQEPPGLRGTAYIAMELVIGKSMRAYLGDVTVSMETRLGWLRDVARALEAAHEAGIVHRDVKPENVMVRADGVVKVLDFGIARRNKTAFDAWSSTEGHSVPTRGTARSSDAFSTATGQGAIAGTPYFMAPEQLRGETLDGRADQFAWGVLAYMLLTGEAPWKTTEEPLAVVSQILSADPPAPRDVDGRIPFTASDTVMRALSKRREARFPSMAEVIASLSDSASARAYEPEVIVPRLPPPRSRTQVRRWLRARNSLVVVVPLLALGAWALRLRTVRPHRNETTQVTCSNKSCVESHGGAPFLCRPSDQACIPLGSDDCTPMYEPADLLADDTVWLGVMLPQTGATWAGHGSDMAGTFLARKEFADATRSFDGANASLRIRHIAMVACDDGKDGMRAAKHLVEDVGVPAIMGFRSGVELTEIAGSLLIRREVLSVAVMSSSANIMHLPQPANLPRMVWRTTYNGDRMAEATASMIEAALEPRPLTGKTRVTFVRPEGVVGLLSFAETFYRRLRFNGKPAIENGLAYREITFPADLSPTETSKLIERIADTSPTFVVATGIPSSIVPALFGELDDQLKAKGVTTTYLRPFGAIEAFGTLLSKTPERRKRFLVVQSTSNSPENARFVIRFNEATGDHVSRQINPGPVYDAFYLLAYATIALGQEPVTGSSLARAFARLVPPAPRIEVGAPDIYQAISILSAGGNIDLQGASTALDFDLSTGEGPSDFALVCSDVGPDGKPNGENLESGVVYDAKSQRVQGAMHCP